MTLRHRYTVRFGHRCGPYWYAFWREGRRVRCAYVGKELPPELAVARMHKQ